MKIDITMTTGWIAAETVDIPDTELAELWQERRHAYAEQGWPVLPDWEEFLHELVFVRFEQPLQQRLEAVEGIRGIDFQESIIRTEDE